MSLCVIEMISEIATNSQNRSMKITTIFSHIELMNFRFPFSFVYENSSTKKKHSISFNWKSTTKTRFFLHHSFHVIAGMKKQFNCEILKNAHSFICRGKNVKNINLHSVWIRLHIRLQGKTIQKHVHLLLF